MKYEAILFARLLGGLGRPALSGGEGDCDGLAKGFVSRRGIVIGIGSYQQLWLFSSKFEGAEKTTSNR